MEGHCSTGQSPEWAVVPMEEEEEQQQQRKNYYNYCNIFPAKLRDKFYLRLKPRETVNILLPPPNPQMPWIHCVSLSQVSMALPFH